MMVMRMMTTTMMTDNDDYKCKSLQIIIDSYQRNIFSETVSWENSKKM